MAIDKLVDQTGYEVKEFGDLEPTHQKAIIWYMAIDGEAWELLGVVGELRVKTVERFHEAIAKELPLYVAQYGREQFGVALIPSSLMKAAWMSDVESCQKHASWDEYANATGSAVTLPLHSENDRWPAILSNQDDEVLEDGWKRCHSYLSSGHADVPVVFYPEERHLAAAAAGPVPPRMMPDARRAATPCM